MTNLHSVYAKQKAQISSAVTAQLISTFVFATKIVQSLFFLNLKFQASSYLSVFVSDLVGNPKDRFSHMEALQIFCAHVPIMKTLQSNSDPPQAHFYMSRIMRKPDYCTCKNKDADQLRGNREADQRLCFRYIDSTIPLLHKSEISSL